MPFPYPRLLHSDDDHAALLEAFGEEPMPDENARHERCRELAELLGPDRIVAALLKHAATFAHMVSDIAQLLAELDATLQGETRVCLDEKELDFASIDSSWAMSDRIVSQRGINERAADLAEMIQNVTKRLDADSLAHNRKEVLQHSRGAGIEPGDQVTQRMYQKLTQRTVTVRTFHKADRRRAKAIAAQVESLQAVLYSSALPALNEMVGHLNAASKVLLDAMSKCEHSGSEDNEQSRLGVALDELDRATSEARALAEEASVARRAEGGFAQFRRTEFWTSRWRIYELWVLFRLLRLLRNAGAQIRLHGLSEGVWQIRYVRATDPIATAEFPEGQLRLYYQLYQDRIKYNATPATAMLESAPDRRKTADMPDLLVRGPDGRVLLVLDPKHGRHIERSEAGRALRAYAQSFQADLTAVVNYFVMPGYMFDERIVGKRRELLGSNIAPGMTELQQLELVVSNVLLAAGYGVHRIATRPAPIRRESKEPWFLFWASHDREVDEPSGLWAQPRDGVPHPIDGCSWRQRPQIICSPDGKQAACISDNRLVLVRKGSPHELELPPGAAFLGWNLQSTCCLVAITGVEVWAVDVSGRRLWQVPWPKEPNACVGWGANQDSLHAAFVETVEVLTYLTKRTLVIARWDRVTSWRKVASLPLETGPNYVDSVAPLPGGSTVQLGSRVVIVYDNRMHAHADLLSVSPTGRVHIVAGPRSRNRDADVTLLRLKEATDDGASFPLLRFRGSAKVPFFWAADESQFAFAVTRQNEEDAILVARPGDRHAGPCHLLGQGPKPIGWLERGVAETIHSVFSP